MKKHGKSGGGNLFHDLQALGFVNEKIVAYDLKGPDTPLPGRADIFSYVGFVRMDPEDRDQFVLVAVGPALQLFQALIQGIAGVAVIPLGAGGENAAAPYSGFIHSLQQLYGVRFLVSGMDVTVKNLHNDTSVWAVEDSTLNL